MDKKNFYASAREEIRDLTEYNPGPMPEELTRVSANENNLGVSLLALDAMAQALVNANRYPDSTCTALRERIASIHSLSPDQIIISNGLDGAFTMLGRAFLNKGDEVITGELTFSVYADTAAVMGAKTVSVPMREDMSLDVEGFISAITDKTKLVFFCNPNNPTGSVENLSEIEKIIAALPEGAIFVLDEAYIEFADDSVESGLCLLEKYSNLLVCRTFSKLYGLAGMRVGWTAGDKELLRYMYKVREPYCVSTVAAEGARAALSDNVYIKETKELVREEREKLYTFFKEEGFEVYESQANFVFVFSPVSQKLRRHLFENGIVVRALSFRGRQALRISVGLPEENRLLIQCISDFFRENI